MTANNPYRVHTTYLKSNIDGVIIAAKEGKEGYIQLANAKGWPRVFQVDTQVKCLICDSIAQGRVICEDCTRAVKLLRSADFTDKLQELLQSEHLDLVLRLAAKLTNDVLAEALAKEFHEGH